jgi:hypothetical protein
VTSAGLGQRLDVARTAERWSAQLPALIGRSDAMPASKAEQLLLASRQSGWR